MSALPSPATRARPALPPALLGLALLGALLAGGCGSPGPRYFRPPHELPAAAPIGSQALTLEATAAGHHLGDRIMWRGEGMEVGFYDLERWTQPPARYVDRALSDALFVARGLRRVEREGAFLRVELVAFEEILLPGHEARVELRALLSDPQGAALFERSFAVTQPVAAEDPDAVSRALGAALDACVAQLADAVQRALGS